ncbi:MAG: endonuclease/exonuclease/phosphatase family protein [Kofleriaceae bacterium]|nr:endonuclease/exonuclease/phosphatase family protein [Kofleriaceae bacterium]
MRALLVAALAVAACRPDAGPTPDAPDIERVRMATFNVRRFFDTVCDSGACESDDYEVQLLPTYFEQRATQIADAIRALDADLVALEEVETQTCLDALLARLTETMPYGVLGEIGTTASVDVAILSKRPIDAVLAHRAANPLTLPDGTVTALSRELLEVHVHADSGRKLVLFAAHFRSKLNDEPARRLAEARVSARIVNERAALDPDAIVVLGGDLNDTPGSPPLDALVVDGGLIRVADDLSPGAQATYYYQGNGQSIDHLLLAPTAAAVRIPHSARVWRDDDGYGGSDHAALSADFAVDAR